MGRAVNFNQATASARDGGGNVAAVDDGTNFVAGSVENEKGNGKVCRVEDSVESACAAAATDPAEAVTEPEPKDGHGGGDIPSVGEAAGLEDAFGGDARDAVRGLGDDTND